MALNISRIGLLLILSFLSVFGFYRSSLLWGVVLLACVLGFNLVKQLPKRIDMPQLLFSILMSLFWLISTYPHNWTFSAFYFIVVLATFLLASLSIYKLIDFGGQISHLELRAHQHSTSVGLIIFLLLVVVWGIYWLAYYPGLLSDDSANQWSQLYGTLPLSEWHPLIHTFLIKLFSINGRFPALFLAIQVLFGSMVVSIILARGYQLGLSAPMIYLIGLFYAFYPVNGYYMVTMWKDTPYSIILLVLFWLVFEIVHSNEQVLKSNWFKILFCLTMFSVGTIRKNGMLVIIVLMIVLVLLLSHKKMLFILSAIVVVMIGGFNSYATQTLHAIKSPPSEALAIPIQQIAAVYHDGGQIPQTSKKYFDKIMSEQQWKTRYNPYLVDSIKFSSQFHKQIIDQNPKNFLINWFTTLKHNPTIFIKAYLKQVAAVWEIEAPRSNAFNLHVFRIPYYGERNHAEKVYQYAQQDPKLFHQNMIGQHQVYAQSMRNAHQQKRTLSEHQYEHNRVIQSKVLQDGALWQPSNKFLDRLFDRFNALPQQGLTRGGLLTFVMLLLVFLYVQISGWKQASLLMCVPVVNMLSLAVSIPAPQFRYVYSLSFSLLPMILGLILIAQYHRKVSPTCTDKGNRGPLE